MIIVTIQYDIMFTTLPIFIYMKHSEAVVMECTGQPRLLGGSIVHVCIHICC